MGSRVNVAFYINYKVAKEFIEICNREGLKKGRQIETFMIEFIKLRTK